MAKVLLVEDDNNLREIYQARLMAEGYDIVAAQNGEEALVVAKQNKPDLIISDVMMPRISGFEMLDILRNTDELKNTKVIMLTALGQAEDQSRADNLGADRYLVKSQVTLEDIVNAAKELLGETAEPEASAPLEPAVNSEPTLPPVMPEVPTPEVAPVPVVPPVLDVPIAPEPLEAPEPQVPSVPTPAPDVVPVASPKPTPAAIVTEPAPASLATPPVAVEPAPPIAPPIVVAPVAEPTDLPEPTPAPASVVPQPDVTVVVPPAPANPAPPVVIATPVVPAPVDASPELQVPSAPVPTPDVEPAVTSIPTPTPALEVPTPEVAPVPVADPAAVTAASQPIETEEAAIQEQINAFANQEQSTLPEVDPVAAAETAANDEAIANAVDELNAPEVESNDTPKPTLVVPVGSIPVPVTEASLTPVDEPAPAAVASPASATSLGGTKIIQPINGGVAAGPSINELLAKEDAKEQAEASLVPPPAASEVTPSVTPAASTTPTASAGPVAPAPAPGPDDPENIAL